MWITLWVKSDLDVTSHYQMCLDGVEFGYMVFFCVFGGNIQKVVADFHIIALDAISHYGLCLVWLRLCCVLFTKWSKTYDFYSI